MEPTEQSHEAFSAYVDRQAADYTDLTTGLADPSSSVAREVGIIRGGSNKCSSSPDPNDSVKALASIIYSKPFDRLNQNLTGILVDGMQTVDIFSMLLDLVLYGTEMLPAELNSHAGLSITNSLLLERIQCYMTSAGIHMTFEHTNCEPAEAYTYRENKELFCEILPKPPASLFNPYCWSVGDYHIRENLLHIYSNLTPLSSFKAFVIDTNTASITTISFEQQV
ncbi:Hypothetical protein MVR_LOCUS116 [uncultured virus]|nr:Hypothetical protein MVR_LOCUS116 [uncultured virus]